MTQSKLVTVLGVSLFLSLGANLLLGGMMLGKSYSRPGWGERHADWQQRDAQLRRDLPAADYKIVKEAMQKRRDQFKALREELDAAREEISAAENAQPFDQAALDAALRAEHDKKTALLKLMRETREGLSQQLSPEGRKIFEKSRPKGHRYGDWRGHGDRGPRPGPGEGPPPGAPEGDQGPPPPP
jgi:Spy/CpxP family protein refolding chaperone